MREQFLLKTAADLALMIYRDQSLALSEKLQEWSGARMREPYRPAAVLPAGSELLIATGDAMLGIYRLDNSIGERSGSIGRLEIGGAAVRAVDDGLGS